MKNVYNCEYLLKLCGITPVTYNVFNLSFGHHFTVYNSGTVTDGIRLHFVSRTYYVVRSQ